MTVFKVVERTISIFLSSQFRGVSRVRKLVRGAWPTSLWERKISYDLIVGLDLDTGYIDKCVAQSGFYEKEVVEAVIKCAQDVKNFIFWDIGANFGLMSLAVKKTIPSSTVFAFEPHPLMATRLLQNSIKNECEISVFAFGLGSTDMVLPLSAQMTGNAGLSSFKPWSEVAYDLLVNVCVRRADSIIEQSNIMIPHCIKIDVEGFEADVLRGFGSILDNRLLQNIIFESDSNAHFEEISLILNQSGFEIKSLDSRGNGLGPNWIASKIDTGVTVNL
jgi:FkbM family methyltransferase